MSLYLRKTITARKGTPEEATFKAREYGGLQAGRITVVVLAITSDQRRTWLRACDKNGIKATPVGCNCHTTGIKPHSPDCPSGRGGERYDTDTGEYVGQRPPATVAYSCQGAVEALSALVDNTPKIIMRVVYGEDAVPRGGSNDSHAPKPKGYPRSPMRERCIAVQQSNVRDDALIAAQKQDLPSAVRTQRLLHQGSGSAIDKPIPAKPRGEYDKPHKPGKVSASQEDSRRGMQADMAAKLTLSAETPQDAVVVRYTQPNYDCPANEVMIRFVIVDVQVDSGLGI